MNKFFFLLVVMFSTALSQNLLAADFPWVGSWGKTSGSDFNHLILSNCNGLKCSFRLVAQVKDGRCSYEGQASLKGTTASLVPSAGEAESFSPNPYGCQLAATLKENEIEIGTLSEGCKAYCTGNTTKIERKYPRVSAHPFNDKEKCFTERSAAWTAWCTNPAYTAKDQDLLDLRIKAENANPSASEKFNNDFAESAITNCEKAKDAGSCLEEKYAAQKSTIQTLLSESEKKKASFLKEISSPGEENLADKLIAEIEGVYKEKFSNGLVDGTTYKSENILEIVRVSKSSIYFKVHTEFFNGHECNLNGLAKFSSQNSFVYRMEDCVYLISANEKEILLSDHHGTCKEACGARGSLQEDKFPRSKKKAIGYLNRLKNSSEYKEAVK